jgi:hypothetical protein
MSFLGKILIICLVLAKKSRKYPIISLLIVVYVINMVIITSSAADRISSDILSANNEVLSISIMDIKGNILAAKSKESFKQAFGVTREGDKYGGTLAVAALAVANEVKDVIGEAQALITIYKNCKMMLLPIPSHQILVALVLQRSVNAEDYNIDNTIERLLAGTVKSHNSNL